MVSYNLKIKKVKIVFAVTNKLQSFERLQGGKQMPVLVQRPLYSISSPDNDDEIKKAKCVTPTESISKPKVFRHTSHHGKVKQEQ
jgi:hypothetical protein